MKNVPFLPAPFYPPVQNEECPLFTRQAQHRRLAKRRGPKRATMAVAHGQLCTIYAMLKGGTTYADLGGDHFERRDADRLKGQLVNRLQRLGFKVTIEPAAAA